MSIVVYKNSVLLSGNIVESDEFFSTEGGRVYKATFPEATLVNATPPYDGRWRYENGEFVDLDKQNEEAVEASNFAQENDKNIMGAVVRAERNAKLSATDWTQAADAPVDQAAWAAYRQALRGISGQEGFPWTITWPVKP